MTTGNILYIYISAFVVQLDRNQANCEPSCLRRNIAYSSLTLYSKLTQPKTAWAVRTAIRVGSIRSTVRCLRVTWRHATATAADVCTIWTSAQLLFWILTFLFIKKQRRLNSLELIIAMSMHVVKLNCRQYGVSNCALGPTNCRRLCGDVSVRINAGSTADNQP